MTLFHQIENSLEITASHQIEKSLAMTRVPPNWEKFRKDCSTKLRKVQNDFVQPNWEKIRNDHEIKNTLEMTVSHQIEKSFKNDCVPPNWETF